MILYMFLTNLVLNAFQIWLKDFKLKNMVVELKTTQPIEPNEEPVDIFNSIDWEV